MNITIVGGGFGGVKAALELSKDSKNRITLITNKPDFQYYPALYGAATEQAHLQFWVPLTKIFDGRKNVTIKIDTIEKVNPNAKTLVGKAGTYKFEKCIFALGTVTTYFGIEGLDMFSYGIKSVEEIKRLKKHLRTSIVDNHIVDKHYVIVGAGPTGTELAAALGSYLKKLCAYHGIKNPKIHINLIEAAPRVLPRMTKESSDKIAVRLKKLGVNVQTGKAVESATADTIMVSGRPITTQTIIWTSGVANNPFFKNNAEHFVLAKNGRVEVDEYLQTKDGIYVIGDNAATPFTGLAQTALHDAIFVAKNFKRKAAGKELKKYKAVMPPVVIPVGERWAAFEWRGMRISGWVGSLIRRAADFVGYSDILPIGQALGVWRASLVRDEDYLTLIEPEEPRK
jgi:NADH:ubiquinone reductase (H+-translocating)